uniref:Uncharacterized protein n=1 Tax=Arundo donax TaxID=35708 RepID=A0A0A9ACS6_ARUDO
MTTVSWSHSLYTITYTNTSKDQLELYIDFL